MQAGRARVAAYACLRRQEPTHSGACLSLDGARSPREELPRCERLCVRASTLLSGLPPLSAALVWKLIPAILNHSYQVQCLKVPHQDTRKCLLNFYPFFFYSIYEFSYLNIFVTFIFRHENLNVKKKRSQKTKDIDSVSSMIAVALLVSKNCSMVIMKKNKK